ncbi:hypothetical protein EUX98_g5678 [Antrodiella citrinella]|uniref:Fungal-type protein kinase domain-containing protein n=1 Tax=Antrodiella citrinella TaxID=2447956 RepID=A0A4S4MRV0_9APHY|nr:hypothetical protein EUX98_g5678 [Antrodiella citrinella]
MGFKHFAEQRNDIMHTLPSSLPEVEVPYFLENALPKIVDSDTLQVVMPKLQPFIVEGRWNWYKDDPSRMSGLEDDVYRYVATISEEVLRAATETVWAQKKVTARAQWRPRNVDKSDGENVGYKHDTNQLLTETRGVGNIGELDKYTVDSVTNFEFKYAMQKTSIRYSFSCDFLTLSYDGVQDQQSFVHFILATSLATHEQLGYDPTVQRLLLPNGELAFDYIVGDHRYRTTKAIVTCPAHRLLGRATRVWRVREIDDAEKYISEERVLKDYWITEDCKTEKEIQTAIIDAAEIARSDCQREDLEKYFMIILSDDQVQINDVPDTSTHYLSATGEDVDEFLLQLAENGYARPGPLTRDFFNARRADDDTFLTPASSPGGCSVIHAAIIYQPCKHRRLVFKEVGTPLHDITNHKVLFRCLSQGLQGLNVMYDAGYVHRDISTGNLLMCKVGNDYICKISDLEYAHPYLVPLERETPRMEKTGTPAFMAVEIQSKMLNFVKYGPDYSEVADNVIHNYVHDAESIWWISLHALFSTVPSSDLIDAGAIQKQLTAVHDIFPSSIRGSLPRALFFTTEQYLPLTRRNLPPAYIPVVSKMSDTRTILHDIYRNINDMNFPDRRFDHQMFAELHDRLAPFFDSAAQVAIEDVTFLADRQLELENAAEARREAQYKAGKETEGETRMNEEPSTAGPSTSRRQDDVESDTSDTLPEHIIKRTTTAHLSDQGTSSRT